MTTTPLFYVQHQCNSYNKRVHQSIKLWKRVAWWLTCKTNPEVHPISPQRVAATLTHGKLPLEKQPSKISWKNWSFLETTLQGTIISPKNGILKMIFLFPRWDMLIPWRVVGNCVHPYVNDKTKKVMLWLMVEFPLNRM